ncbi:MAG TPA: hypothetical protein GX507_09840 [Clostridia bacterium]|nr:hypothetical protein [Clostridia bacterium]
MSVGLMVLRVPVVKLAFQRGAFDAEATEATAFALLFFCMGITGFSLRDLVSRGFYSLHDTRTPMIVGIGTVGLNIVLNLALLGPLKHGGLALAAGGGRVWALRRRVRGGC